MGSVRKRVIVGAVSEVSLSNRHFRNGVRSFRYKSIRYRGNGSMSSLVDPKRIFSPRMWRELQF